VSAAPVNVEQLLLADDGLVPNNAALALLVYRRAVVAVGLDTEAAIIAGLAANGWGGAWVDGIYPFHHYHARSHEVLVFARGDADVQLGGPSGPVLRLAAGDAVLIPAGVGHRRIAASADLSVVGAYPAGQEDWDLKRATAADRALALTEIPRVARPPCDPIRGGGPPWP
jgi:uncharacterized protein YjlB